MNIKPATTEDEKFNVFPITVEGDTSTDHDAWLKSAIEATLAKKSAGKNDLSFFG